MDKKQQIIIFILVGIMVVSVFGTGILLIVNGGGDGKSADQVSQEQALQQLQEQEAANNAQCGPLSSTSEFANSQATAPEEPFIPKDKVTKLVKTDLKVGDGETVQPGDCIVAHYQGSLASDGTIFDSSYERGQPARFPLSGVIEGWQAGVPGMKEGGIRRLVIPGEQAYGEAGSPPQIGPNADLVFDIELVKVVTDYRNQ